MKSAQYAGIYVLRNKINGLMYVGQSSNIENRLDSHNTPRKQPRSLIDRAIKKHSWPSFEVFAFQLDESLLDFFETEMITHLNTMLPNGYNIDSGGHKNKHLGEEHKKKISEACKGKCAGYKHYLFGKHPSKQTLQRMSEATAGENNPMFGKTGKNSPHYGKRHSESRCKKISEGNMGEKNGMFGEHHSEETKKKWSSERSGKNNPMFGVHRFGEKSLTFIHRNKS